MSVYKPARSPGRSKIDGERGALQPEAGATEGGRR
jgi:hypothetical protein